MSGRRQESDARVTERCYPQRKREPAQDSVVIDATSFVDHDGSVVGIGCVTAADNDTSGCSTQRGWIARHETAATDIWFPTACVVYSESPGMMVYCCMSKVDTAFIEFSEWQPSLVRVSRRPSLVSSTVPVLRCPSWPPSSAMLRPPPRRCAQRYRRRRFLQACSPSLPPTLARLSPVVSPGPISILSRR